MEQSLADLLTDAFTETSLPSFPEEELDFEKLSFDAKFDEDKTCSSREEEALHQEATGQSTVSYMAENDDERQFDAKNDEEDVFSAGVSVTNAEKTPEEGYESSDGHPEEEGSVSGGDDEDKEEDTGTEEKTEDRLLSVRCGEELWDVNDERHPLVLQGAEIHQVRDEDEGESEGDEELSCFGRLPKFGHGTMMEGEGVEEEQREEKHEDDSECEDMKTEEEEEEELLNQCFTREDEDLNRDESVEVVFEFPEMFMQNLQDLVAEVESEEYDNKMKDFSGEEHQEAGESFADYPSDFSSCEYTEDGGKKRDADGKQDSCLEGAVTDITWMSRPENTEEEADGAETREADTDEKIAGLHNGGKAHTVEEILGVKRCEDEDETGKTDSYSSSGDEIQMRRSDEEEFMDRLYLQDAEDTKQLDDAHAFSRWSISGDHNNVNNPGNLASEAFSIFWDTDVSTAEAFSTDDAETSTSNVTSDIIKSTRPSNQGSVDDSFFFSADLETCGISELGLLGDDEYEEESNWEQEQERIKAFYKFYNDSDEENGREGRKIKVQFCTDPLSRVIHYDTDSSDRDSLNSSTDEEEEALSTAETSEAPPDQCMWTHELREPESLKMRVAPEPSNTELPEDTAALCGTHKCVGVLKLIAQVALVVLMGLLMFWLTSDQLDWLRHVFSF